MVPIIGFNMIRYYSGGENLSRTGLPDRNLT
jgi:hypothetical protein